jgi:hypothetical protein
MTTARDIDRNEWILLALKCATNHRLTPLKLQKTLFLLGERRKADVGSKYYAFQPYHYGPFDANVYRDADELESDGLIALEHSQRRMVRKYVLTDHGELAARDAAKRCSVVACEYLNRVVKWAEPLPFNELVRAIYEEFPRMRANSIFEER